LIGFFVELKAAKTSFQAAFKQITSQRLDCFLL